MAELWKDIVGYEGKYQVSNLGRVRRLPYEKVLKPQKRKHGYLSVWLYLNDNKKQVSIHRLVAEAFCVKRDGANEVNHLNENKQDNRAENLEWCNRSENCSYGELLRQKRLKRRNNERSTPVRQLTMDGTIVAEFPSMHEARRQTGFGEANIHRAVHGVYKHAYGYKWEYAK